MRNNDNTSAVRVAVNFDSQCTGTRIALPLYASYLPSFHASVSTTQARCPRGNLRSYSISPSHCATTEPSCRKWRYSGHMPGKRS